MCYRFKNASSLKRRNSKTVPLDLNKDSSMENGTIESKWSKSWVVVVKKGVYGERPNSASKTIRDKETIRLFSEFPKMWALNPVPPYLRQYYQCSVRFENTMVRLPRNFMFYVLDYFVSLEVVWAEVLVILFASCG